MSTFFRYLTREIFQYTGLLLLALVALFALFDLIHELGDLAKSNLGLPVVLAYVALSQPAHVTVIFPVAALMGTLLAISRMSTQSELTVMRASGLSLTKLAGYSALIGMAFSVLIFLFGEIIVPVAKDGAQRLRLSATSTIVAQRFRSGLWAKDDLSFVNIEDVTPKMELINLRIYKFDRDHRLSAIWLAERGNYDSNNRWNLKNVEKTTFEGERARIERLPAEVWSSAMTPDLVAVLLNNPEEMSLMNLSAYIDHLRENRQNSTKYELARWGKLLQPAAVIIMMLLAIPFAIQTQRAGGIGANLLLGIMIGLGFYFLNQLASNLTVLNDWPPMISASAPLLLFFGFAAVLILFKEYSTRVPRPAIR